MAFYPALPLDTICREKKNYGFFIYPYTTWRLGTNGKILLRKMYELICQMHLAGRYIDQNNHHLTAKHIWLTFRKADDLLMNVELRRPSAVMNVADKEFQARCQADFDVLSSITERWVRDCNHAGARQPREDVQDFLGLIQAPTDYIRGKGVSGYQHYYGSRICCHPCLWEPENTEEFVLFLFFRERCEPELRTLIEDCGRLNDSISNMISRMNWRPAVKNFYMKVLKESGKHGLKIFDHGMHVLFFIRSGLTHTQDRHRPDLNQDSAREDILEEMIDMFPGFFPAVVEACFDYPGVREMIEIRISCADVDQLY